MDRRHPSPSIVPLMVDVRAASCSSCVSKASTIGQVAQNGNPWSVMFLHAGGHQLLNGEWLNQGTRMA